MAYMKERYREAFNEALRGAVEEIGAAPRELLRLHLVERETLESIAARLGVHRATVARRIAAAREGVAAAARRRLRAALRASEAEVESLVRVMKGEMDLSLTQLLSRPGKTG
jgi:RNA polymerase sigma-70 factor (ECF subfamily)